MNDHAFNGDKSSQLIAYIAKQTTVYKLKLMKLLYIVDFTAYEELGQPITGDTYVHWPMGPVPRTIFADIENLQLGNYQIERAFIRDGEIETWRFKTNTEWAPKLLSLAELDLVDRVLNLYGNSSGQDLMNLTHEELPYRITSPQEVIPYFLAPYRRYKGLSDEELTAIRGNKELMVEVSAALSLISLPRGGDS